jgi:hypothetical protein
MHMSTGPHRCDEDRDVGAAQQQRENFTKVYRCSLLQVPDHICSTYLSNKKYCNSSERSGNEWLPTGLQHTSGAFPPQFGRTRGSALRGWGCLDA